MAAIISYVCSAYAKYALPFLALAVFDWGSDDRMSGVDTRAAAQAHEFDPGCRMCKARVSTMLQRGW